MIIEPKDPKNMNFETNGGKHFSFKGLVDYLTNEKGLESRVGEIRCTNFTDNESLNLCVCEAMATAAQNKRVSETTDKTLHLIITFPAGERPDYEVLKQIEDIAVKELGMEEHQRISVVHRDTDNLHMHIAINKIHPKTKNCIDPYQSVNKCRKAAVICEEKFGLIKTNHDFTQDEIDKITHNVQIFQGEKSLIASLKEISGKLSEAKNWNEFHKILKENQYGVKVRSNGLVFYNIEGTHVKASTINRSFSKSKLEQKFGAFQESSWFISEKHEKEALEKEEKENEEIKENVENSENPVNEILKVAQEEEQRLKEKEEKKLKKVTQLNESTQESIQNSTVENAINNEQTNQKLNNNPQAKYGKDQNKSLWNEYQELKKTNSQRYQEIRSELRRKLNYEYKLKALRIRTTYRICRILNLSKPIRSMIKFYFNLKFKLARKNYQKEAETKINKLNDSRRSWLAFLRSKAEAGNPEALEILLNRNKTVKNQDSKYQPKQPPTKEEFTYLKSLIEKNLKLEKVTSNGNKIYQWNEKTVLVTEDKLYINNKVKQNASYSRDLDDPMYLHNRYLKKAFAKKKQREEQAKLVTTQATKILKEKENLTKKLEEQKQIKNQGVTNENLGKLKNRKYIKKHFNSYSRNQDIKNIQENKKQKGIKR
ncbi:MAG: relaxase/mobilization nuclease domain-containing protein [Ruminobacter sp.]|nr:relaxase/mobilization nuclease domain-containing protein [Ruminobacter sp.]